MEFVCVRPSIGIHWIVPPSYQQVCIVVCLRETTSIGLADNFSLSPSSYVSLNQKDLGTLYAGNITLYPTDGI